MADRPATAIAFDVAAVVCAVTAGVAIIWGAPTSILPPLAAGAGAVLLAGGAAASIGDRTGQLLDGIAGLLVPACILAPLAWVARDPDPAASALAIVALGLALLAFYVVARARSLGFPAPGGILVRVLAGSAITAALVLRGPSVPAHAASDAIPLFPGVDWVSMFLLTAAVIEALGAAYVSYRVADG